MNFFTDLNRFKPLDWQKQGFAHKNSPLLLCADDIYVLAVVVSMIYCCRV